MADEKKLIHKITMTEGGVAKSLEMSTKKNSEGIQIVEIGSAKTPNGDYLHSNVQKISGTSAIWWSFFCVIAISLIILIGYIGGIIFTKDNTKSNVSVSTKQCNLSEIVDMSNESEISSQSDGQQKYVNETTALICCTVLFALALISFVITICVRFLSIKKQKDTDNALNMMCYNILSKHDDKKESKD